MSEASYLYIQAGRCFRLARGPASPRLADELEALGRAFEEEAKEIEIIEGQGPRQKLGLARQHALDRNEGI